MSPKVADKELVSSANAVLAAGKEKWFGQFTNEGIDKTSLSSSAQSALGEDVKAFQRLSALSKMIAAGKASAEQKEEAAKLVTKLEGANSAEAGVLAAAKTAKNGKAETFAPASAGTPKDEVTGTAKDLTPNKDQGEMDYTGMYAMIGDPQGDGGGQGAGGQQQLTPEQIITNLRESKKPALMDLADELDYALKGSDPARVKKAQTCLAIYARAGEGEEFDLALAGFRAGRTDNNRVSQPQIDAVIRQMDAQLSGASLPTDENLKPALTVLGDKIKESISTLNTLDRVKDKDKWEKAQEKLQESLDIYVNLKDFDSRNRQQHLRDAYDNMNRARAMLGLTEIKLTMESRVNREISGNELQYNRNTADSNIEAGRTDAGNMTLKDYTQGANSGDLTLNQAAGGSKTLRDYAQNSAGTEEALLRGARARNERGREGLRDRREKIKLTRETIGEINGTVRETRGTIDQIKKDPLSGVLGILAIGDALKGSGKPPKGW